MFFFCFFLETWEDAEISINRWLSVICGVMKTFPCRKSLSFLTTSLGRHTQQIPSLCLSNVNRKNKRRLWRMVAGGNIWLNPHSANHGNMKKKKKHIWKNTDTRLQPDLFSLFHLNSRNFMNGKCQGIGFPKPLWPVSHELTMLFWWVHAGATTWSATGGDGTPTSTLSTQRWNLRHQDANNEKCVVLVVCI